MFDCQGCSAWLRPTIYLLFEVLTTDCLGVCALNQECLEPNVPGCFSKPDLLLITFFGEATTRPDKVIVGAPGDRKE